MADRRGTATENRLMRRTTVSLLALMAALSLGTPGQAADGDLDGLLAGVNGLTAPGCIPGPLVVFGPEAFVVVSARTGKLRAATIGATRYGKGRAVAYGHEGFAHLANPSNQRLLVNAVGWLGSGRPNLRVALFGSDSLAAPVRAAGHTPTVVTEADLRAGLPKADVLLLRVAALDAPQEAALVDAVAAFVERGGGVLGHGLGWGWSQLNPGKDLPTQFGGNRLLVRMGLAWSDGYLDPTAPNGVYLTDRSGLDLTQADRALAALTGQAKLDAGATAQAGATLALALRGLPADEPLLLAKLDRLVAEAGTMPVPTAKKPIRVDQPLARLAVIRESERWRHLPPEKVTASPAAADFPGAVLAEAPRVSRSVEIDTAVPGWQSLGLYAPPGEVVEVTLPATAAGRGLAVRIGPHTDQNWHHDSWARMPSISLGAPCRAAVTRVANPYGGLVYLDVPGGCKLGRVTARLAGCVEAPLFVNGVTPPALWREKLRALPGPWAELATKKVILTVPSAVVRDLDDPAALMTWWDSVMDATADLVSRPHERQRPERYCTDRQISAGYMHSGYPIMTHLDVAKAFVDLPGLRKGNWGMFHEMGHNHQSGHWTFDGTGEVTVNLFTLYVYEHVCGDPIAKMDRMHEPKLLAREQAFLAKGAPFAEWKSDPFLALRMYVELIEGFGWDALKRVINSYNRSAPADLPKTDDDKRDQWLVRYSREVGRNLGPFFQRWGVPTSPKARDAVKDLPNWLP